MASSAPPVPPADENATPAPAEATVFDSVYNWITDGTAPPQEGEEGAPEVSVVDSIASGLESVGTQMTGLLSSVTGAGAASEEGKGKEPAEGETSAQHEESALENFSKQANETTEAVTASISTWYYGPPPPAEGEEVTGEPAVGFKHTVDEQLAAVSSWWGGAAATGEQGEAAPAGDGKPLLADWFLPAPTEEGAPPAEVEKVDVDTAVTAFFSGAAQSLQKLVDKGPPPPDRTKAPAQSSGSAPAPGVGDRRAAPAVPRAAGDKPAATPPPRPVSSKAAVFGSTTGGVRPPPRPSGAKPPI